MEFREFAKKHIVSFDFDDTLFMNEWERDEEWGDSIATDKQGHNLQHPHEKMIKKLKDHKKHGDIVYLVTSRRKDIWKDDIANRIKS